MIFYSFEHKFSHFRNQFELFGSIFIVQKAKHIFNFVFSIFPKLQVASLRKQVEESKQQAVGAVAQSSDVAAAEIVKLESQFKNAQDELQLKNQSYEQQCEIMTDLHSHMDTLADQKEQLQQQLQNLQNGQNGQNQNDDFAQVLEQMQVDLDKSHNCTC